MTQARRPRVAAIGMSDAQLESISMLCGDLRHADTLAEYLQRYNWRETDVVVAEELGYDQVDPGVNLMIAGHTNLSWRDTYSTRTRRIQHRAYTRRSNTEREVSVPNSCPDNYNSLAVRLSNQIANGKEPPPVLTTSREDNTAIIETTSGHPVALRIELPQREVGDAVTLNRPTALLLPRVYNLAAWFTAFLVDVNVHDPRRVPQPPPRLQRASDWYTPKERALAAEIDRASVDIRQMVEKRDLLQEELVSAGKGADRETRRVIWEDGEELVAAVSEILSDLGFQVQDMDAGLDPNEQRHEDLRLTVPQRRNWEGMVEVKGYTNGTRTNDARQIREHREHYISEKGQPPDLTLWIVNPFRHKDPSSRPSPSSNVGEAASNVGAVHVLATDLYRLWVLAQIRDLDAGDVVQELIDATPGLWKSTALGD